MIVLFFKKHLTPRSYCNLTGQGGAGIYSSSSVTLSTAGCCKKIPQGVRSKRDPDKFFFDPKLFFMDISLQGKIFFFEESFYCCHSRGLKKVKSLMFLEFIFHAHHTRLNEGFILIVYRSVYKYPRPTTK